MELERASGPPAGYVTQLFSLHAQVAIVTGGSGVLGGAMAHGLARAGARVAVLGRRVEAAQRVVAAIEGEGGQALAMPADVLSRAELQTAREVVLERWGRLDILVNAAGGNVPAATTGPDRAFFDLPDDALRQVIDLNLLGTILPSQVFGAAMAGSDEARAAAARGCIVNISSFAASHPLTRVVGYAAAKAAVENLTRWLATDLARSYGAGLRVNALAPGFFLGEQNRRLLTNEDGTLTPRGQAVIDHTPAGRFGTPDELIGTLIWLCSPAAAFVTGQVIAVDGGASACSGI